MSIYYTYIIGWSDKNVWYYGRRTAKDCNPTELWVSYFTSSKYVKAFRNLHGDPNIIQVRRCFSSVQKCCIWENKVLSRMSAASDTRFLNKTNGDGKWDNTGRFLGMTPAKLKDNINLGFIKNTDPRWITGEIFSANKGKSNPKSYICAIDITSGNTISVKRDDPRWETGEIVGNRKGHTFELVNNKLSAVAKDLSGISIGRVLLSDPRWKSGEVVGIKKKLPQ